MSIDTIASKSKGTFEEELNNWIGREKAAIKLMSIIGTLRFDRAVELIIFRNQLHDCNVGEILAYHEYARKMVNKPISIFDSLEIAEGLTRMNLAPAKLDLGKLAHEWLEAKEKGATVDGFLKSTIGTFTEDGRVPSAPKDVVLYGFGRIGRLAARELISQSAKGDQLRLRAIVARSNSDMDIYKRADLLRTDSIHGPFPGTIEADIEKKALIINGHTVLLIAANSPSEIDYTAYGINDALVIDNTGVWRDADGNS